jgi:topoisomerase-4 subunit B
LLECEGGEQIQESYVNLIPTAQGGTHVNGLRSGVTEALREFCELRNLLPRNMKLSAEDVWDGVNYICRLSSKNHNFQVKPKSVFRVVKLRILF